MSAQQPSGPTTLRYQGAANAVVRLLLHVPLLSRRVGSLMVLYVVGRTSGRRYSIPVTYTPHQGRLLVGSGFAWVRNLRTGEPVRVLLAGRRRTADVEVVDDEPGVVELYGVIARANGSFAQFNRIGIDADGEPRTDDLHRAWAAGGRVVRLTPR